MKTTPYGPENGLVEDLVRSRPARLLVICCVTHDGDTKEEHAGVKLKKNKPIIYCGDLNVAAEPIDLANPEQNHFNPGYSDQEREKFRELKAAGFVDSFRYLHPDEVKYSWWSYRTRARERNVGWRIDYFMVQDFAKDQIKRAEILTDVHGSDHCPVLLEMDI